MTAQEAEVVLQIMMNADGGCPTCAACLARAFAKAFPQFESLAARVYAAVYHDDMEER